MGKQKQNSRKDTVIEYCPLVELPADKYKLLAEFSINGEPGRKSNQRRIVKNRRTGKLLIIKSQKSMNYANSFREQLPEKFKDMQLGSINEPLALWAHIYYGSNRPDVSSETIMDLLQETGVIKNDRYLKAHFLFGSIDRENPRAYIRIYGLQ